MTPTPSPAATPSRIAGPGADVVDGRGGDDAGEARRSTPIERSRPPAMRTSVPPTAMIHDRRPLVEDVEQVARREEDGTGEDERRRRARRRRARCRSRAARRLFSRRKSTRAPLRSGLACSSRALRPRAPAPSRTHALMTASSVIVSPSNSRDDRSVAHDEDAMGEAEHLLELGGDEQHRHARPRRATDELVDRALGADVDAARRLVGDEQARATEEPLREQHLLLVAARERATPARPRRRPHVDAPDQRRLASLARAREHDPVPSRRAEVRQGHVLVDRPAHQKALGLARLGQERDARGDRLRGERDPYAPPIELDRPASWADRRRRSRGRPRCGRCRRGPASPTISPARRSRETSAQDGFAREALDARDDRGVGGRRRLRSGRPMSHRAPEHRGDDEAACLAGRRGPSPRAGRPAGRSRRRRREHLLEEVRDVDDRGAPRRAGPGRSRAAGAPRRVVSAAVGSSMTISLRLAGERAQDLDLLLVGGAERARPALRREVEPAPARRARRSGAARRRRSTIAGARGSMPRKTFSTTLRVGTSADLLGDDRDAVRRARPRRRESERPRPSTQQLAVVRLDARRRGSSPGSTCRRRSRRRARGPCPRSIETETSCERLDAAEALAEVSRLDVGTSFTRLGD